MAERPIIKLERSALDKIMEGLGFLALVLLLVLPIYYYPELPDRIPRHYDASGQITAFGGKGMIWVMPILGLITYAGLFFLNKIPHLFNYPSTITPENAERQYRMATRLIRTLNVIIVVTFLYTTYATIQNAIGNQEGLGKEFMPVFLIALFGTIAVYLIKAFTK
ncbi:DUF1648 domain-containing protein [Cecembia calidifontis]|jgi:uncharacterized membrane protein|uniref:Uncharacterized protein DUF1648 n=1 Tax=Cecembia calidifontis TaxID=1187080 RepID=A0A4Q7P5T8_9BACT|nr:DUF1648 domain-containing protein [Cecembia calidifontis]RZS94838.1 uncharacterized protein DUF1648 [Cecembia calidifontis]